MDTTPHHLPALPAAPLLDVAEVAQLLQKPRGWVYDHVESGDLPAIRIGRHLRFDRFEVARWLDARRTARALDA